MHASLTLTSPFPASPLQAQRPRVEGPAAHETRVSRSDGGAEDALRGFDALLEVHSTPDTGGTGAETGEEPTSGPTGEQPADQAQAPSESAPDDGASPAADEGDGAETPVPVAAVLPSVTPAIASTQRDGAPIAATEPATPAAKSVPASQGPKAGRASEPVAPSTIEAPSGQRPAISDGGTARVVAETGSVPAPPREPGERTERADPKRDVRVEPVLSDAREVARPVTQLAQQVRGTPAVTDRPLPVPARESEAGRAEFAREGADRAAGGSREQQRLSSDLGDGQAGARDDDSPRERTLRHPTRMSDIEPVERGAVTNMRSFVPGDAEVTQDPAPEAPVGTRDVIAKRVQDVPLNGPTPTKATTVGGIASVESPSKQAEGSPMHAQVERGVGAVLAQRGGSIVIRLAPATLGTLKIQVQVDGANVSLEMEATTERAHAEIMGSLKALKSALESRGLQLERAQVHLAPPSAGSNTQESLQQRSEDAGRDGRRDQNEEDGRGAGGDGRQPGGERGHRESFERAQAWDEALHGIGLHASA